MDFRTAPAGLARAAPARSRHLCRCRSIDSGDRDVADVRGQSSDGTQRVSGAQQSDTLFAILPSMVLLRERPHPFQTIGIAAIGIGAVTLSIDRRWLGMSWSYWALALPIGVAAIRGMTQPITKLGPGIWPSPFAATPICYTMSSIVVAIVARSRPSGWPSGYHRAGLLWFGCVELAIASGFLHFMRHSHEGRCFWCRRLLRPTHWLLSHSRRHAFERRGSGPRSSSA
jgi:hypothetical protein